MIYEDVLNQMSEDELRNYVNHLQKYACSLNRECRIRRDIAEVYSSLSLLRKDEVSAVAITEVYSSLSLLRKDEVSAVAEGTRLSKKLDDIEDSMREKYGLRP